MRDQICTTNCQLVRSPAGLAGQDACDCISTHCTALESSELNGQNIAKSAMTLLLCELQLDTAVESADRIT